jgi:replicative DNA helicase
MRYLDCAETVVGLVLSGHYSPDMINTTLLPPPYDKMIVDMKKGANKNALIMKYGNDAMIRAMNAAEPVSPDEYDWLVILEQTAIRAEAGARLEKLVGKLKNGDEIDESKILEIAGMLDAGHEDFVQLSKVEPDLDPWIPSFWKPLDDNVGGLPKAGLVVIGAPPGTGKTSMLIKLMVQAARNGKRCGFFSLEMTLSQIANRFIQVDSKLKKKQLDMIHASEEVVGVHEICAKASRLVAQHPDIYLIGIDFADLLVEGEQSEQVMGEIYKSLAVLAKRIRKPVVLLSQLSRRYEGGVPMVTHLRYSGMAEATASMVLLLYNPDSIWANMGNSKVTIPHTTGTATVILGKTRYGFRPGTKGAVVSAVGYFSVKWDGSMGWGDWSGDYTPLRGV